MDSTSATSDLNRSSSITKRKRKHTSSSTTLSIANNANPPDTNNIPFPITSKPLCPVPTTSTIKTTITNPFLLSSSTTTSTSTIDNGEDDGTILLDHIINVVVPTSATTTPTTIKAPNDKVLYSCDESLQYIIQYLLSLLQVQKDDNNSHSHTTTQLAGLSTTDIIQILLPWCITQLQQRNREHDDNSSISSHLEQTWKILNLTISISILLQKQDDDEDIDYVDEKYVSSLSKWHQNSNNSKFNINKKTKRNAKDNNNDFVSKIITQSILYKLLPKIVSQIIEISMANSDCNIKNSTIQSTSVAKITIMIESFHLLLSLFRPTMEVACKNILLPIIRATRKITAIPTTKTSTQKSKGDICDRIKIAIIPILQSTIQWIYDTIYKKSNHNPKTTFLLYTTLIPDVAQCYYTMNLLHQKQDGYGIPTPEALHNDNITTISLNNTITTIQTLREMIFDIYFHAKHHIEGFVNILQKDIKLFQEEQEGYKNDGNDTNLNTSSSSLTFRTYHDLLFEAITNFLPTSTIPTITGDEYPETTISSIVSLLPILFHGFLHQSSVYAENTNISKNKTRDRKDSNSMTNIQYQLFVKWIRPLLFMLRHKQIDCQQHIVSSIRQMLQIVLDNDIYAPTFTIGQNDNNNLNNAQYKVLQSIVIAVFDISKGPLTNKNNNKISSTEIIATPYENTIHCLQIIFQLHHSLLEQLHIVETMKLCIDNYESGNYIVDESRTKASIGIDFIVTTITTYRQLRQQSHIYCIILAVVDDFVLEKTNTKTQKFHSMISLFMNSNNVRASLSESISACPIDEIKSIFHICNEWMIRLCTSTLKRSTSSDPMNHDIVFQLGLSVIIPLLTILTRNVTVLNSTSALDIATCCQLLVQKSIEKLTSIPAFISIAMILTGLLVELHIHCIFWLGPGCEVLGVPSKIFDQLEATPLLEGNDDAILLYESVLFLSCYRLKQLHSLIVDQELRLMAQVEDHSLVTQMESLITEAQQRANFIATESCIGPSGLVHESYRWVVIAQNFSSWVAYCDKKHIIEFLQWVILTSSYSLMEMSRTATSMKDSKKSTMPQSAHLIFDADEMEVVKCLLADNTFYQHVQVDSLMCLVGSLMVLENLSGVLNHKHGNIAQQSTILDDSYRRLRGDEILKTERVNVKVDYDKETIRSLQVTANVSKLLITFPTSTLTERSTINFLDLCVRIDISLQSIISSDPTLQILVINIASNIRRLLAKVFTTQHVYQTMYIEYLPACDIVTFILKSTQTIVAFPKEIGDVASLVLSTGDFLDALFVHMPFDQESLSSILKAFSDLKPSFMNVNDSPIMSSLSRRLIIYVKSIDESIIKKCTHLIEDVWDIAVHSCETQSWYQNETLKLHDIPETPSLSTEGLLLLGDLISLPGYSSQNCMRMIDCIYLSCVQYLGRATTDEDKVNMANWNVMAYLTCRIAVPRPTLELVNLILVALTAGLNLKYNTEILEASIYYIVPTLIGDDILLVLEKLVCVNSPPSSIILRMRLLQRLLRYVTDTDKIEVMSSMGRQLYVFAITPICSKHNDTIVGACSLLEDIIKRRDIVSLKEKDLSQLLSFMVGALGPVRSNTSNVDEQKVFLSTADLFVTVFHRYTKQLYACVPSVISMIYCMLRHTVRESIQTSCSLRCQRFTRICELLVGHKEVYKKYVIGLVLEFISAVEISVMSLQCREALIPAVYFLLDCMSTFEMQQLNAQLNAKARIVLRSIHSSYQKLHNYKGQ